MAGLDGVQNKIHPGDPIDKNLYDLPPEEAAKVPHPLLVARRGAGPSRQGPRVPDPRRRVLQRHDRRLHRAEDGGGHALPHDHASGRVRHVLQLVTASSRHGRTGGGPAARLAPRAADCAGRCVLIHCARMRSPRTDCCLACRMVHASPCAGASLLAACALSDAGADRASTIDGEGNVMYTKCTPSKGCKKLFDVASATSRRGRSRDAATADARGFPEGRRRDAARARRHARARS